MTLGAGLQEAFTPGGVTRGGVEIELADDDWSSPIQPISLS
jgi:hypothetical protein